MTTRVAVDSTRLPGETRIHRDGAYRIVEYPVGFGIIRCDVFLDGVLLRRIAGKNAVEKSMKWCMDAALREPT